MVIDNGSAKTVAASVNATPCLRAFAAAFVPFQISLSNSPLPGLWKVATRSSRRQDAAFVDFDAYTGHWT